MSIPTPPPLAKVCDAALKLPCAPSLLPRLALALQSDSSSAQEIERLITLDPSLAAATLRLANSASYGRGGVDSVEEGFAFHRSIVRASGNGELLRILDTIKPVLFGTMRVMRENVEQREAFTSEVRAEHDAIVDAIAAGNPEQARQAVPCKARLPHLVLLRVQLHIVRRPEVGAHQGALAEDGAGELAVVENGRC